MNQDLIILLLFIVFIAGLFLWAWWLYARNKKHASQIVLRIAVAIVLAIPFLFFSFVIIFISLWNSGGPRHELNPACQSFAIVNNTSVPLWASVNAAYTPGELEDLYQQGIDIDLTENFVIHRDTLIPNEGTDYQRSCYSFTIPIPHYVYNVEWPSELRITLRDTINERIAWIYADDIDSTMRAHMQIIVTDSMLQSWKEEIDYKSPRMPRKRIGGDR